MKEIKQFLSKVLTAESLTKEIREEALQLRDLLDFKQINPLNITYPYIFNGEVNRILSLSDLHECKRKMTRSGKISYIKELRSKYGLSLLDAKNLAEWLLENNVIDWTE